MVLSIFKGAAVGNALAVGLKVLSGLLITSVLLRYCGNEEVSTWYVMLSITTIVTYIEMGLSANIGRFVAQAAAGASSISGHGVPAQKSTDGIPNLALISDLAWAGLLGVAFLCAIALCILSLLIWHSGPWSNIYFREHFYVLFILQIMGVTTSLLARSPLGVMQGNGMLREAALSQGLASLTVAIASTLLVISGMGVIGALSGQLLGGLVVFLISFGILWRRGILYHMPKMVTVRQLWTIVWPSTWRTGLSGLMGNLTTQSVILLAGNRAPSAELATYGLLMQIGTLAAVICNIPLQIQMPTLIAARVGGDLKRLRDLASAAVVVSSVAYGSMLLLALWLLPLLLLGLGSRILPPASMVACVWFGVRLLEFHHCACATVIVTGNRVPFLAGSVVTCVAIYCLGYSGICQLNILNALIIYGFAQLTYNNWFPPLLLFREMRSSFIDFYISGGNYAAPFLWQTLKR